VTSRIGSSAVRERYTVHIARNMPRFAIGVLQVGRPRKDKSQPKTEMSNVTDETIADFIGRALSTKAELDDATSVKNEISGRYRNILKQAKAAGINPDVVTRALRERKKTQEQLDMFDDEYRRIRHVMGWDHASGGGEGAVAKADLRPAAEFVN